MNQHSIHETVVRDIIDVASSFKDSDEIDRVMNYDNRKSMKSITSKTEALTMVFPVICSRNMTYDAACMISKAIERKAVTMLQMLFSAANITDAEDGIDYISNFHTNLPTKRLGVDDFMNLMDKFVDENGLLVRESSEYEAYKKIQKDMQAMNFYFEFTDSVNDSPISDYTIITNEDGSHMYVNTAEPVNEAKHNGGTVTMTDKEFRNAISNAQKNERNTADYQYKMSQIAHNNTTDDLATSRYYNDKNQLKIDNDRKDRKEKYERRKDAADWWQKERSLAATRDRNNIERDKAHMANRKAAEEIVKLQADIMRNRLIDNDVKKANELVPTLMYVNFITKGTEDSPYPIATSMVVGVKAKLYVVDGEDIMNRLKIKNNSKNLLLNLIKVSTREISFFRDFLFAVDTAKIDAMSQSRRGSSNKIWKILERRAIKSRFRRLMNMKNDATAISTLCMTQDEVDFLRKTAYIDVENPSIIGRIMDAYNLMGFVIVDDALEICKFLFDDESYNYEVLTYDSLEREQKDNTKKILNLMSKMR